MKRFRVISKVTPAIRIEGGINFTFQQSDGTDIIDYIVPSEIKLSDGKKVQTGWTIICDIFAENVDDAKNKAGAHIDGLLSCASLISGVSLQVIDPDIVYSTQEGETNEFIQFIESGPLPSRRKLNGELFVKLISKLEVPPKPEYNDRITRAIRWFRMGTLVPHDILTSYDCFWKGLESLNKPLAEILKVSPEYDTCSKCGNKTIRPTTGGIKKFLIDNYSDGAKLYKQFRNIRVKIVHSTDKISDILPIVQPIVDKLALILYDSILFLLELDKEPKYGSLLSTKSSLAVEGNIGIADEAILKNLDFPYLLLSNIEIVDVLKSGESFSLSYNGKFEGNVPDGYSLSINAIRLYGQEMSGFKVQEVRKISGML